MVAIAQTRACLRRSSPDGTDNVDGIARQLHAPCLERRQQASTTCRFRFQDETHDLLKNSGLEKISLSPISVSIETISANFRFQLRLIDRSIDRTIIDMAGLIDDPNDPHWQEAERRDQFLRELLKATGWKATRDVVDAARMTFGVSRSALEREASLPEHVRFSVSFETWIAIQSQMRPKKHTGYSFSLTLKPKSTVASRAGA